MNCLLKGLLRKYTNFLPALLSLFVVVVLASCNLPTFERDTKELARKTGDKISDATRDVREAFDPEKHDLISPDLGMSRQDIRDELVSKTGPVVQDVPPMPVLPDVSTLLIEPRPPLVGQDKLVSISVTEDVPLRDVIMELARRADIDVEIDPGISGGIIFRAKNKPFSEVIERIAELSGLRYSIKSGVLKVERDTAFIVNYNVDILNMIRSNNSSVNISTQVLGGSESGGSFNSGSSNELSASYEGDIWQEIETTLNNIIGNYSGRVTTYTPSGGADTATNDILGAAPIADASATGDTATDASAVLAINRHAGIVTVLATNRQHREVKQYLDKVIRAQSAQVLIEAKIIEVNLTDEYRTGIDWNSITYGSTGNQASGDLTNNFPNTVDSVFTIGVLKGGSIFGNEFGLDAAVKLVQEFGVVRTLSNPRINATNNQQAVLTFAENRVFFDLTVQNDQTGTGVDSESTITVDSEVRTIPIGVIMTLQPSIDLDKNEITMNVRPTLSRVTDTVSDPGLAVSLATINNIPDELTGLTNDIPIVEVREIDSVLRVKNGQVMVIGGLIEERHENENKGVPGVSEVPYVGNLFKSVTKTKSVVETVIFIKATIVPGFGVEHEDKDFYRTFSTERRKMAF